MGGDTKAVDDMMEDDARDAFEQAFLDVPDVDDSLLKRGDGEYIIGEVAFAFYMFRMGARWCRTGGKG